jgi:hypothetical protein
MNDFAGAYPGVGVFLGAKAFFNMNFKNIFHTFSPLPPQRYNAR